MALAEWFDVADILESLAWCGMSPLARIRKLACDYIAKEDFIERKSGNYDGPTSSTVRLFVKSVYCPPRGTIKSTVDAVMADVLRQKRIRGKRANNKPYKVPQAPSEMSKSRRSRNIAHRRNKVAEFRYGIITKGSDNRIHVQRDYKCVTISRIAGWLVLLDKGSDYGHQPRLYVRSPRGVQKVFVMDGKECSSLTNALLRLAPKAVCRGMFEGVKLMVNFHAERIEMDGTFHPFRNVRKVYRGAAAVRKTRSKPVKPKPVVVPTIPVIPSTAGQTSLVTTDAA